MSPDLSALRKSNKLRPWISDLEPLQELKQQIHDKARENMRIVSWPRCKPVQDPSHPLARNLRILTGPEADSVIHKTRIPDIKGATLNFPFLSGVPVIVMERAPQPRNTLRHLTKLYNYEIGWREGRDKLGWAWVSDSVLVVSPCDTGFVFHCLAVSSKSFPEVCLASDRLEEAAPLILNNLDYQIGKSNSSLIQGTKRRGGLKCKKNLFLGQEIRGQMGMEGWVRTPLCLKPSQSFTYSFYRLKQGSSPEEVQKACAPHIVSMNALEELYCPGANAARWEETKHLGGIYPGLGSLGAGTGVTATSGYACQWHLDSSTRGTFESILFGPPPDLPKGHRWVFGLCDAGVLLDLSESAPLFLMIPGQDVLHGTLFTGEASGRDHIEHKGLGSALLNKHKLTTKLGQDYPFYEMVAGALRVSKHDTAPLPPKKET